jgi:hypothetical protein
MGSATIGAATDQVASPRMELRHYRWLRSTMWLRTKGGLRTEGCPTRGLRLSRSILFHLKLSPQHSSRFATPKVLQVGAEHSQREFALHAGLRTRVNLRHRAGTAALVGFCNVKGAPPTRGLATVGSCAPPGVLGHAMGLRLSGPDFLKLCSAEA